MSNSEQFSLFDESKENNEPVVCLGMTFESDEARREYFREELRKKLPELKQIEGFPIGEDEDIIALSDPPYYTACPNPWMKNFVEENVEQSEEDKYYRQPLATDISEGKSDPAYMAHAYHTKVPSKAVAKYVMHYTEPGDIILDGFSGSGMTGVGVQVADSVQKDVIPRKVILNDLSTAATHITKMFNIPQNVGEFVKIAEQILNDVLTEFTWLSETFHENDPQKVGKINYIIWSEVFLCPTCSGHLTYWNLAVDEEKNVFKDTFACEHCGSFLEKKNLEKVFETKYDECINQTITTIKHIPVKINYTYQGKRYEKNVDNYDLSTLAKIDEYVLNKEFVPAIEFPQGDEIDRLRKSYGYTHTHHLYSKRSLIVLSRVYEKIKNADNHLLLGWFTSALLRTTKMYKFTLNRKMGTVSGTYYVPSIWVENFPGKLLKRKISDLSKVNYPKSYNAIINVGSQTKLNIPDNSVDYIFTDPPFGENLMYSELNFVWESWLKLITNNKQEAIMNKTQKKGLAEYYELMFESFSSYYRVLKPNRWITIVFSNSKASVWNIIKESIERAGFVIANVSALDKKQGSFKAVTTTTAVKQDLVISAYKPSQLSIQRMREEVNTPSSAWTFVSQHLSNLTTFSKVNGEATIIIERTPRILFDRMVAYHVQNGLPVPISSAEFQEGVAQRFPMRDGMAFLESQVAEYDKKRTLVKEFSQMSLFVSDENSAIEWIRQQLMKKPQTRQDLHPQFMKEIQHIAKHEQLPELDSLLVQNFLRFEGGEDVPNQIATYLRSNYHDMRGLENSDAKLQEKAMNRWYVPDPNKQADLEKLREKALLREFDAYVEELGTHKKKLKLFRTEAIRAGFKKAWSEKDYTKIVTVGDRLPESVIQEDDKLLMYYDNAQIRVDM